MPDADRLASAASRLQGLRDYCCQHHPDFQEMVNARDEVLDRFRPIFAADYLPQLTAPEFREFLILNNNKHWTLQRQGPKMCEDMSALQQGLLTLLDDSKPVEDRLDEAIPQVKGMGKAVATAILHVNYPEKYGVWNNTSEWALKTLDLWPDFDRVMTSGQRYRRINQVLHALSEKLETDLWTLDGLFMVMKEVGEAVTIRRESGASV